MKIVLKNSLHRKKVIFIFLNFYLLNKNIKKLLNIKINRMKDDYATKNMFKNKDNYNFQYKDYSYI